MGREKTLKRTLKKTPSEKGTSREISKELSKGTSKEASGAHEVIRRHRYLTTFALTTLIFIIGILIGHTISTAKQTQIQQTEETLYLKLLDIELQSLFLADKPCEASIAIIHSLSAELDNLQKELITLEGELGKNHPKLISLKKPYTLILLKHYLLSSKRARRCNEDYTLMLYFYSNTGPTESASEKQGYILSYLNKKYGYDKVKVYAIDANLDLEIISTLKQLHNITTTPSIVINEETYTGFQSLEVLDQIIQTQIIQT